MYIMQSIYTKIESTPRIQNRAINNNKIYTHERTRKRYRYGTCFKKKVVSLRCQVVVVLNRNCATKLWALLPFCYCCYVGNGNGWTSNMKRWRSKSCLLYIFQHCGLLFSRIKLQGMLSRNKVVVPCKQWFDRHTVVVAKSFEYRF